MPRLSGFILGLAVLLAAAIPLRAQAPGYQQLDTRQIYAEYRAEVLTQVNAIQAEWGEAWAEDDIDALVDLYWENAVLISRDGRPHRGHQEIRAWFEANLEDQGTAEAFMLDFDASGSMAVIYGNYAIEERVSQGPWKQLTGPMMTVFSGQGRTWKIRSQVFIEGGG